MRWRQRTSAVLGFQAAIVVAVLFSTSCERPPTVTSFTDSAGERRTFTGTWTATGTRQTLALESGRWAAIYKWSGSLLLSGEQRLGVGFRSEVIGFSDSLTGLQARGVWTDERGDKVFSELAGKEAGAGKLIEGRFIGGSGRYAGVTGEYSFKWQYLSKNEVGGVSGRVVDLKGWAQLASPDAVPPSEGGQR